MGIFRSRKTTGPPRATCAHSLLSGPHADRPSHGGTSSACVELPPMIELASITQRFGSQLVLRDISLTVEEAETLVIIGESGCGKSVTLKLMMALLDATAGNVFWRGRPVADMPERQRAKQRLSYGFLFQGAALFDSMSVSENVAFGLRQNTDLSETKIREIVRDRLREVGLKEVVCDRKPADLSGGMKKRVALARALGSRARGHVLRRADDGSRSGDERRHQRADSPHKSARPRHEHCRDPRHAHRRARGRSGDHAVSRRAAET